MKNTVAFGINLFASLLLILIVSFAQAQDIQIKITGIRSAKGEIILSTYENNKSYDKGQPFKKFVFDKKALVNGTLAVRCDLEAGTYGITLLDDENENGIMDKNMVGWPKEGFGFSDFYMEKLQKPTFDDFKVDLKSHNYKVDIRVKYM